MSLMARIREGLFIPISYPCQPKESLCFIRPCRHQFIATANAAEIREQTLEQMPQKIPQLNRRRSRPDSDWVFEISRRCRTGMDQKACLRSNRFRV
jgi:hypothetical protein